MKASRAWCSKCRSAWRPELNVHTEADCMAALMRKNKRLNAEIVRLRELIVEWTKHPRADRRWSVALEVEARKIEDRA